MIRNQRKWIALLVAVTFIWLLQASTMPLPAAGSTEQVGSANAEQGPGYVEAVGHKYVPVPKKSILPYVLIGVGVVAVAAVLFLVVLKTSYDIIGSWDFVFTGSTSETHIITFSGTKTSGTWLFEDATWFTGKFTVDGKKIVMSINGNPAAQISGQFTGKDAMNGTWVDGSKSWSWTATRNEAAIAAKPTPAAQTQLFTK
jgi:hypothetical protein